MIVGSRLVRAAAEAADAGEDPAAAVGAAWSRSSPPALAR